MPFGGKTVEQRQEFTPEQRQIQAIEARLAGRQEALAPETERRERLRFTREQLQAGIEQASATTGLAEQRRQMALRASLPGLILGGGPQPAAGGAPTATGGTLDLFAGLPPTASVGGLPVGQIGPGAQGPRAVYLHHGPSEEIAQLRGKTFGEVDQIRGGILSSGSDLPGRAVSMATDAVVQGLISQDEAPGAARAFAAGQPFADLQPLSGGNSEELAALRGVDQRVVDRIRGAIVQAVGGNTQGWAVSAATDAVLQGLISPDQAPAYAQAVSGGQAPDLRGGFGQGLPMEQLAPVGVLREGQGVLPGRNIEQGLDLGPEFGGGGGGGLPGVGQLFPGDGQRDILGREPSFEPSPADLALGGLANLSTGEFIAGGGQVTPTQARLIDQRRRLALMLGESELGRQEEEAITKLREEIAPGRGLRVTDTPIAREVSEVLKGGLRARADLNRALLQQASEQALGLPLQVQQLVEPARQFQANLTSLQLPVQQAASRQRKLEGLSTLAGLPISTTTFGAPAAGGVTPFSRPEAFSGQTVRTEQMPFLDQLGRLLGGIGPTLQGIGAVCWVAAALYGEGTPAHLLARYWIGTAWRGPVATIVRAVYRAVGPWLAPRVRRSRRWQRLLRPLFDRAVRAGAQALGF